MGSSGSFGYSEYSPSDIRKNLKTSENEVDFTRYEVEVNALLGNTLIEHNNRDKDAISSHIDSILSALHRDIDGSVSTLFGGSLSKNTHINGLSDIDTLVILNNSDLAEESPEAVLDYFCERLQERFPNHEIQRGDTAVTVEFVDMDVQLLPAIKVKKGIKIPDGGDWSNVIDPKAFAKKLTDLNQNLQGRLIPTIKLIKGINANLPDNIKLKGYHIESLAVKIFENKILENRTISNKELLISFYKEAASSVKIPIRDITSQSKYADAYLGGKDSIKRVMAADFLDRTYRKLELADMGRIVSVWNEIINGSK